MRAQRWISHREPEEHHAFSCAPPYSFLSALLASPARQLRMFTIEGCCFFLELFHEGQHFITNDIETFGSLG